MVPRTAKTPAMRYLVVAFLLLLLNPSARADFRLFECRSTTLTEAALWVKVRMGSGIVAVSEDAWFESEGEGDFTKLSQPLALDAYLKHRALRDPAKNYIFELETTAAETLRVELNEKIDSGRYTSTQSGVVAFAHELTCRPDQVPSPH